MKKRQEGSAMILVLCVLMVTTALCLALLLGTSVSMRNATRAIAKEQCRINAVSVSDVLIAEIKGFKYGNTLEDGTSGISPNSSLEDKLQTVNTNTWYANNTEMGSIESWATNGKVEYTYKLTSDTLPGDTEVRLYWVNENEDGQECPSADYPEDAASWFGNIILYMEVTSTVGEESSTIISCFQPIVDTSDGDPVTTPDGDEQKKWSSWTWNYLGHEWERGES